MALLPFPAFQFPSGAPYWPSRGGGWGHAEEQNLALLPRITEQNLAGGVQLEKDNSLETGMEGKQPALICLPCVIIPVYKATVVLPQRKNISNCWHLIAFTVCEVLC